MNPYLSCFNPPEVKPQRIPKIGEPIYLCDTPLFDRLLVPILHCVDPRTGICSLVYKTTTNDNSIYFTPQIHRFDEVLKFLKNMGFFTNNPGTNLQRGTYLQEVVPAWIAEITYVNSRYEQVLTPTYVGKVGDLSVH